MIEAGVASTAHPSGEESAGGASPPARPRRTRSQISKSNNQKGKDRERRVVAYLRVSGFPGAERTVRTGYRNGNREFRDRGDIDGTPGIVWQIKAVAECEWYRVPQFMLETDQQKNAAGADIGILVIPRPRYAHPAEWWAHVWYDDTHRLVAGDDTPPGVPPATLRFPIRMELQELLPLLRLAGYGTTLTTSDSGAVASDDNARYASRDLP